jgi:hypothetical protein
MSMNRDVRAMLDNVSRRGWIVVGITAGAVIAGVLGGVLLSQSKADASGEWGKALVTLFVAILISGLLTLILSEYSRSQQQQAADRERTVYWLRLLVGASNHLHGARIILGAQKSAETYSDEVRGMVTVRESLRSMQEDLKDEMPGVAHDLGEMLDYLSELGFEYSKNYFRMSWRQRLHEERVKRYLAQSEPPSEPIEDADDPLLLLQGEDFPALADLLSDGRRYREQFRTPYKHAKQLLEERLNKFGSEPHKAH